MFISSPPFFKSKEKKKVRGTSLLQQRTRSSRTNKFGSVVGRSLLAAGSHLSPLFLSGEEQTGQQEGTLREEETHVHVVPRAASGEQAWG